MSSSPPPLSAPTARLLARTARAVVAADSPQDALVVVLNAVRTSLGASEAALVQSQDGQLVPVACEGMTLATEPMDEATLTRLGLTGYPLVIGGRVEGLLLVRGRSPRWLAAREARLLPLLDLAALALRNARLAAQSRTANAEITFQAGLLNAVAHAVIASDLQGTVLYWNRVAEQLYGWSANEIVGRKGLALLVPDDQQERGAGIMTQLVAGQSWSGEFLMRRRDGTTFLVQVTDSPVLDSQGRLVGIIAVSFDITKRKRDEESLRASEERFRGIVETAEEGMWATDALGVTTFVNRRLADLLGYDIEAMLGRPLDAFLDDEGRALMANNIENRRQGLSQREDVKFLCENGTAVWAQVASTTLLDADGGEMGAVAMIADVTERRRAETDRARLAAIVTSSEDAIYAKSLDGIITDWNRGAEHLYGYEPEEIVGQPASRLAPSDRYDEIPILLERLGRGERIDRFDTVRLRKDGSRIEVAVSLSPILDTTGRVTAAAVIAHDITAEREAAQERLELVREQAAHASAERAHHREEFLAEASRHLGNSLDYEATLREIAPLAVPGFADDCLVYLTDDEGEPQPLAVAHVNPPDKALLVALQQRHTQQRQGVGGVAQVIHTGRSVLYSELSDADHLARGRDAEHVAMLQILGSRSAMIVPLTSRGRTFGAMSFVQSVSGRHFTLDDLSLAEDLAGRCAQAIDNSLLYRDAQREITERKKIEAERAQLHEQVAQERATLAAVVGGMSDGLLLLDAEGCIVYCNAQAGELVGLVPAVVLGQPSQVAFRNTRHVYGDPDKAWSLWLEALSRLKDRPTFHLNLAGPTLPEVHVRLFPVAGGPLAGGRVGVLIQDVTAERELQHAKEDLVSMVSHEIASPATSLVSYAELLASTTTMLSPAERDEMLASMVIEGQRLNAIIRDFLDIQRLENQRLRIVPRPSDLRPLLEHAATIARSDAGHRLVVDLPDRLPLAQVDPHRVQQVLSNLLSNARKYTPAGGEIRLAARVIEDGVELSVVDNGLGIPAEALPHLFEKFYRVGGPERRNVQGTGLGLAIVKELVEAQGGRIGVESTGPGRGSRFWFTVPIAGPDVEQAVGARGGPAQGDPAATAREPSAQRPLRVLVVDDDPMVGKSVTRVLRLDGHRVKATLSAEDALHQLESDSFDVVVSDLGLGTGLDGRELASRVRASWPGVHFVLATGSVGIDQVAARADGVEAFLPKPYGPQDLRDLISEVGRSATTKEAA